MTNIPVDELNTVFELLPDGTLVWRKTLGGHIRAGHQVGSRFDGYRRVKLFSQNILVHRIIFALANDRWPLGDVDHINGDKSDNHPGNLREVNNRQNHQNRSSHRSGRLVGATFHKNYRRWQAQARLGNKKHFLGFFDTEAAAHAAYKRFLEMYDRASIPTT